MRYRNLGETDIKISEIGFGCWGIGGFVDGLNSYGETSDDVSLRALKTAFDNGINFFDTANIYGLGHSEELIGRAFGKCRDRVVIATKCGFDSFTKRMYFNKENIEKSIDQSLKRLDTDYIDLLQLHDPEIAIEQNIELLDCLKNQVKIGKIKALGVSVKNPMQGMKFMKEPWQSIQCNFNMIDLRALECGLFLKALQKNVSIIARTPLAFGFLSGQVEIDKLKEGDHRLKWPKEQLALWGNSTRLFAEIAEKNNMTSSELAIKFCVSFDAVTSVIPGMLTTEEVIQNSNTSKYILAENDIEEIINISKANNSQLSKNLQQVLGNKIFT